MEHLRSDHQVQHQAKVSSQTASLRCSHMIGVGGTELTAALNFYPERLLPIHQGGALRMELHSEDLPYLLILLHLQRNISK